MFAAVDAPRIREGPRDVVEIRRSMQGAGHLRELQGDSRFTTTPPAPRYVLEVRQGLAKAGPLSCLSDVGVYYYFPAESRTLRIKDVSQATRCGVYEVERPQLCSIPETPSSRRFGKAPRPQFTAVAALAAEPRVPEVDRDRRRRQSYEESPPDGDARPKEVAPAAGVNSLPHLALPDNDGDAVEAIRGAVGFEYGPY